MQYLLMLYAEEAGWNKLTKAEQEQGMAACKAYTEALTKAGILRGSNRLQPSSAATTVRVANGKPQVLDGPYVESKEQVGGYYLIDVADLDAEVVIVIVTPHWYGVETPDGQRGWMPADQLGSLP